MKIVSANQTDLPAIMRTIADCVAELTRIGIAQWDAEYPNESVVQGALDTNSLYAIREAENILLVASLDTTQPEEYRSCQWRYTEPAAVVHHLCVHPSHWRVGLANSFMDFAESRSRSLGIRSMRLDACEHNPAALSLYRARSYSEAGTVVFPRNGLRFICFEKKV